MAEFNNDVSSNVVKVESWLGCVNDLIDVNDFIPTDLEFLGFDEAEYVSDSTYENNSFSKKQNYVTGRKKKDAELSMSKNAILARENRFKKKKFLESLVRQNKIIYRENSQLKKKCDRYDKITRNLRKEISYLRSIILNQSSLSKLLQNIPTLMQDQLDDSADEVIDVLNDAHKDSDELNQEKLDSGICLHVASNTLHLSMCPSCNSKAQKAHKNVMKLSK